MTVHRQRRSLVAGAVLASLLAGLARPGRVLAQDGGKLKVAGIFTAPFEQQWVGRVHRALKAAEARGDIDYQASEKVSVADYDTVLRERATGGAQLIVGEAFELEDKARKVAKDFPKTAFLMGSARAPRAPNFATFDNWIHEAAYLSGMVAGGLTQTHRIGLVGGFPMPAVNRLMRAFRAGAREVDPKVEFTVAFIDSWYDAAKAREATLAMIDKGIDVLYAERFGVAEAAREKGKLAIGSVANAQPQYPETIVTSALWHMEPTIDRAVRLVKDGKFGAEDYAPWSSLKNKGSELAPLGSFANKVPPDLMARVRAKEADIVAGRFIVRLDDSTPRSSGRRADARSARPP